jgi:hypothetical protein
VLGFGAMLEYAASADSGGKRDIDSGPDRREASGVSATGFALRSNGRRAPAAYFFAENVSCSAIFTPPAHPPIRRSPFEEKAHENT